jgi:hypothetical protein
MRSMLVGAGLPAKFWPYAFQRYLRLYNLIPHAGKEQSPYEICGSQKPDLSRLRTFGCCVYAVPEQPNNRQAAKLDDDSRKGILLGFAGSMKNALYFDLGTEEVRLCQRLVFDEAMADMLPNERPPNARALDINGGSDQLEDVILDGVNDADALGITFSPSPFESMVEVVFPLSVDGVPGFEFADCSHMHRAFVTKILSAVDRNGKQSSQAQRSAQRKYTGSYIVEVEGAHVVTCNDIIGSCPPCT